MEQAAAGHDVRLETERLLLRPFETPDFEVALPYYQDPEFRSAMEGNRDALVTRDYLERAGEYMARRGYLFAIVEKASRRAIGEVCLEWMNLSRANVQPNERVMRLPIGIWDKTLWGKGYGREIVKRLMAYAFEAMRIDRLCAMDVACKSPGSSTTSASGLARRRSASPAVQQTGQPTGLRSLFGLRMIHGMRRCLAQRPAADCQGR